MSLSHYSPSSVVCIAGQGPASEWNDTNRKLARMLQQGCFHSDVASPLLRLRVFICLELAIKERSEAHREAVRVETKFKAG